MNFRAIFLFVFTLVAVAVAFPSQENRLRRDAADSVKSAASDAKEAVSDAGAAVADAVTPTEKSTTDKVVDSVKNMLVAVAVAFPSQENRLRRDAADSVKSAASDAKEAVSDAGAAAADAVKSKEKSKLETI
ncbi:unnamed protein product [Parnassius apollo]|uniref:(apollo) hypothetical protein n=1 Tax=Parnassius apollo TaxID=110799 RepID=A0A8S3XZH8_PARAO|nr:unnamed protein product [Parnassius apollo]